MWTKITKLQMNKTFDETYKESVLIAPVPVASVENLKRFKIFKNLQYVLSVSFMRRYL